MPHVIDQAARRISKTNGASFLTRGGDDYDHRGLNKARRAMGKALIAEVLEDVDQQEEEEATWGWVVTAWLEDGDKPWLDSYDTVRICDTQSEAEEICKAYEEHTECYWEYRQLGKWELEDKLTGWL